MSTRVDEIFNDALLAMSVAALDELQLLEELRARPLDMQQICRSNDLHQPSLVAMLRGLHKAGIVSLDETRGIISPGRLFADTLANKGYFRWLIGGYGDMLINMGKLTRNANRTGNFVRRDQHEIATAAADYGERFVDAYFHRALEREPFAVIADLGCGEGARLMNVARQHRDVRGIGIELDRSVVRRANEVIVQHGLAGRLQVIQDDVKRLDRRPEYEQVDVLLSFFMGHDLWPRADCLSALRWIHAAFPNATRFLLADTYRSELREEQALPIFTFGFEITHALMGQTVPTIENWLKLFEESAWLCVERYNLGIAHSCVFDLRRRS